MNTFPLRSRDNLPDVGTLELAHLVARVRAWYALSVDEALVALGVWAGCTDAGIATWLGWDEQRVADYLLRCCTVLRPLGLGSRTGVGEAVVRAMQAGGR